MKVNRINFNKLGKNYDELIFFLEAYQIDIIDGEKSIQFSQFLKLTV